MSIKDKILIYNFLTVFFAVFAFASLGGLAEGVSLTTVIINFGFFASLTYNCACKESRLRYELKHKKAMKKRLRVASQKTAHAKKAA